MIDIVVQSFLGLSEKFTLRRGLYIAGILALIIGGWIVIEWMSGYFYFSWQMEKKVALLKDLHEMSKEGISDDPRLAPLYNDLVNQMHVYSVQHIQIPTGAFGLEWLWRFLAASCLWLMVMLYGVFAKKEVANRWPIIVGAGVVAFATGVVGIWLPDIGATWINIVLYIMANIGVFILFSRRGKNQSKRQLKKVA